VVYVDPEKGCCWVGLTGAMLGVLEKGWLNISHFSLETGAFLHSFMVSSSSFHALLREEPYSCHRGGARSLLPS
jgi:hypothetical protein